MPAKLPPGEKKDKVAVFRMMGRSWTLIQALAEKDGVSASQWVRRVVAAEVFKRKKELGLPD